MKSEETRNITEETLNIPKPPVTDRSIPIASAFINGAIELSLNAVPACYEVRINDDLIFPCNTFECAFKVYKALLEDMKG